MAHRLRGQIWGLAYCPFEDVLGIGHGEGFTSMIVPGKTGIHVHTKDMFTPSYQESTYSQLCFMDDGQMSSVPKPSEVPAYVHTASETQ